MDDTNNPLVCSPCQQTIYNFVSEIDKKKFQDHTIEDGAEPDLCSYILSTLSVRIVKDRKIDELCRAFNERGREIGTGNEKKVEIKAQPQDENDDIR